MTDTQKRWLMIGGALVVIVVLLALLFRPKEGAAPQQPPQSPPSAPEGQPTAGLTTSGDLTTPEQPPSAPARPPSAALAVRLAAMVFAERYGSYSTSSDFVNIAELSPFMTERFRRDREAFVATARAQQIGTYHAATAAAILANVTLPDGEQSTRATAVVTTQRSAQEESAPARTFTQDITLEFLRVGDMWVVDGATWGVEF